MDFRADLHLHSTFSDGIYPPEKLLRLAKEVELSGVSITDHDTISAYSEELFDLAKDLDIQLLTGVEISSSLLGDVVHILGYGFDYKSKALLDFLEEARKKRKMRNQAILKKLSNYNIQISIDELYNKGLYKNENEIASIGRPHIAKLMVEKGFVRDFKAAFSEYLKDGAKCYVEGEKFSPSEVISKLHEVKAKAIIAHPHLIKDFNLLQALLEMPFDGIEAYYGRITPDKEKRWLKIAEKKGWIITGGSDFHGDTKPFLTIGCSWVSKEIFDQLNQ
jgi:predicted metal-dependent phosphoesterase TrpH